MNFVSNYVAGMVTKLLANHCDLPLIAYVISERGYTCFPGKRIRMRKPDVSCILAGQVTSELLEEDFISIRPDRAIEVISPNDLVYDLRPSKSVEIIRATGMKSELGPNDELTGEDILPGFRCRVADIFAGLPESKV